MKSFIKNYFGIYAILVLTFLISCTKNDDTSITPEIITTKLPEDVTQLFIEKGNKNSNKVILYSIGGPNIKLDTEVFDDLGLSDYHEVYVHQTNTYNKELIVGLNEDLTFERAVKEDELSVQILHIAAKYFKSKGKEVYVIGHSFGAFIIPSLLAIEENLVTKYLIMAGRLDMPDIVWKGFRDRNLYSFKDGITPTKEDINKARLTDVEKKTSFCKYEIAGWFRKKSSNTTP